MCSVGTKFGMHIYLSSVRKSLRFLYIIFLEGITLPLIHRIFCHSHCPKLRYFKVVKLQFVRCFSMSPKIIAIFQRKVQVPHKMELNLKKKIHSETINKFQGSLSACWAFPLAARNFYDPKTIRHHFGPVLDNPHYKYIYIYKLGVTYGYST